MEDQTTRLEDLPVDGQPAAPKVVGGLSSPTGAVNAETSAKAITNYEAGESAANNSTAAKYTGVKF